MKKLTIGIGLALVAWLGYTAGFYVKAAYENELVQALRNDRTASRHLIEALNINVTLLQAWRSNYLYFETNRIEIAIGVAETAYVSGIGVGREYPFNTAAYYERNSNVLIYIKEALTEPWMKR
jgi:hypothetical protein